MSWDWEVRRYVCHNRTGKRGRKTKERSQQPQAFTLERSGTAPELRKISQHTIFTLEQTTFL